MDSAAAASSAHAIAAADTAARPAAAVPMALASLAPRAHASIVDLTLSSPRASLESAASSSPSLLVATAAAASSEMKYFAFHTRRKKPQPRATRRPRKQIHSSDEESEDEYSGSEAKGKHKSSSSDTDSGSEANSSSSSSSSDSGNDDTTAASSKASKPRKKPIAPRSGAAAAAAVSKTAGKAATTAARPSLERLPSASSSSSAVAGVSSSSASRAARLKIFKLFVPIVGATAAPLIERALFEKHGGTNAAYNAHVRDLLSSLRLLKQSPTDSALLTDISLGTVSAPQLVSMSTKDLATADLRQLRQSQEQELMRNLQRPVEPVSSVHTIIDQQREEASSKQLEAAIHLFESSARAAAAQQSKGRSSLPSLPPSLPAALSSAPPLSLAQLPNITDFLNTTTEQAAGGIKQQTHTQRKGEDQGAKTLRPAAAVAGKGPAAAAATPSTSTSKAATSTSKGAPSAKPTAKAAGVAASKAPGARASAESSSSDDASSSENELLIVDTPTAAKSITLAAKSIAPPARPAVAAAASTLQKRKAPAAATSAATSQSKLPASNQVALNSKPIIPTISAPTKSLPPNSTAAPAAPVAAHSAVAEPPAAKRSKVDVVAKPAAPVSSESITPPMIDATIVSSPVVAAPAAAADSADMADEQRETERKSPALESAAEAAEEEEASPAEEIATLHPTDPLHLPTRVDDANAVSAYTGQLSFAFPRRGELPVALTPLPVKDLFPPSVAGTSASARLVSEGVLSQWDTNCWAAILPSELTALHKMRVTEIERYIQFKANLHNQPTRAGSAAPSPSIQAASRLYPLSFTMRSTEPLLAALARDMSTFHRANKLALALDFESSSVAPARQCVLWLIPPGSLQYLTHRTASEVLHWQSQPSPHEWWGILWVKAFAFKAMRKNAEVARRRAQAELDVPSDGEDAAGADADMTEEKSAQQEAAAAAVSAASEQAPATSNPVLQLIQDPDRIASTASYLSNLLHKVSSKPEAAAAASSAVSTPAPSVAAASAPSASSTGPSLSSIIASIRSAAQKHLTASGTGAAAAAIPPSVAVPLHPAPVAPAPPSPPPPVLSNPQFPTHTPQFGYQPTPPAQTLAPFVQPQTQPQLQPQPPPPMHMLYSQPPQPPMQPPLPMQFMQPQPMMYAPQQPTAPMMWQPQPQPPQQPQQQASPYAASAPVAPPWQSAAPAPVMLHLHPPPMPQMHHSQQPPPPPAHYAPWASTQPPPPPPPPLAPAGWQSTPHSSEQAPPHATPHGWTSSHLQSTVHPARAHIFKDATQQPTTPPQPPFASRIQHRG